MGCQRVLEASASCTSSAGGICKQMTAFQPLRFHRMTKKCLPGKTMTTHVQL